MNEGPVHILLVEDDDIDVRIIKRALLKEKLANPITVARDGIEAFELLHGKNQDRQIPRPYLVLLDLNMPRMNGFEFLDALRKDELLRDSIVFILTTSATEKDKLKAYQHNVAGYLLKTQVGKDFMAAIKMLDKFMLTVQFPPSN